MATNVSERPSHVAPNVVGGWSVRKTGAKKAIRRFDTEREAATFARMMAERDGGVVYYHRSDGTVREKRSYPV